jgi:hypothetical protein
MFVTSTVENFCLAWRPDEPLFFHFDVVEERRVVDDEPVASVLPGRHRDLDGLDRRRGHRDGDALDGGSGRIEHLPCGAALRAGQDRDRREQNEQGGQGPKRVFHGVLRGRG